MEALKNINPKLTIMKDIKSVIRPLLKVEYYQLEADIKKVDPNYKLPEFLTTGKLADGTVLSPEAEHALYAQEIIKHTDFGFGDDPFLASYLEAKAQDNFKLNEWMSQQTRQYSYMTMPDDDLLFSVMKDNNEATKRNWTDDQIKDYLSKLDPIDKTLRADAARNGINEAIKANNQRTEIQNKEKLAQAIVQENQQIEQDVVKIFDQVNKLQNIGGLPHGEAERGEFQQFFSEVAKINPKTGVPFVNEILADDTKLYTALYLLYAAENGFLNDFKEEYKDSILSKLSLTKKGHSFGNPNVPRAPESQDFL